MNLRRPILLATCITALVATAGTAVAASNNANAASKGYPNGRPWQAMKADFAAIKQALAGLGADVDGVTGDLGQLHDDITLLREDLAAVSGAVSGLGTGLQIQVSVMDDAARDADNDAPVTLFVHVAQNGQPVTGLTSAQFSYTNAFPVTGASFCGDGCFTAGDAGVYAITLNGDWSATAYAGTLAVSHTVTTDDGDVTSHGSTMVNFDIPAAPPAP